MRMIRNIAGLLVVAVLAGMLLVGARSPDGQSILGGLGQTAAATGKAWRANIPGLSLVSHVAGNLLAAVAIGALLVVAATWLVPATRSGRGMVLTGVGAALLAAVLYSPGLLGGAG